LHSGWKVALQNVKQRNSLACIPIAIRLEGEGNDLFILDSFFCAVVDTCTVFADGVSIGVLLLCLL